jgi:hypothetical protein
MVLSRAMAANVVFQQLASFAQKHHAHCSPYTLRIVTFKLLHSDSVLSIRRGRSQWPHGLRASVIDRGFESHSEHDILVCVHFICVLVFLCKVHLLYESG